jgi:uncharacterized membrane protein
LLALLVLWALLLAIDGRSIGDAISGRGWNWTTTLFFAGALVVSLLALWRGVESAEEDDFALTPALAATSVALLLILGAELFYVRDLFGSRLNSVFKLYYQAWLLLAVSGAFSAWWVLRSVALPSTTLQVARGAALGLATLCVAGGLLYPLGATLSRTGGLGGAERTLDGTRFTLGESGDEHNAIEYLRGRAGLGERIVEAAGDPYSQAGRVSARTGIATVLGWDGHEVQWGRDGTLLAQRRADVDRVYTTPSLEEALSILQKYDVTYVFIGGVERNQYPPEALLKFESALVAVFRSGDTVIYRTPVDEPAEATR